MAIATVKATKLQAGSGTSASVAVSATAGNALIVGGASFNGSTWTVTRTGDTYTTDSQGDTSAGANRSHAGIASAPNVAGGSVSMTVASTGANGITAYAAEVSGLPSSSIRDATSPAILTGNSGTASTNSLTNATANAIFFALGSSESGANPATFTSTATGFSDVISPTTMKELNGSSFQALDFAWRIVSSVAAQTETWTIDSNPWGGIIAVYKASGAGPVNLTATVAGAATVTGLLGHVRSLVASSAGVATVTALLGHLRGLAASSAGLASVVATLTKGGAIKSLVAATAGAATVSATFNRLRSLSATVAGVSTVSASLVHLRKLIASTAGVATVSATLGHLRGLAATAAGVATVVATFTSGVIHNKFFTAAVAGLATVAATLGLIKPVPGEISKPASSGEPEVTVIRVSNTTLTASRGRSATLTVIKGR